MRTRRAFTLIELLVVISVIGLLVGIMVPVLRNARNQAKRSVCAANLHQIGIGLHAYLSGNRDRFPFASALPSFGPAPLETDEPIYFAEVLAGQLSDPDVFRCPEDIPGRIDRPAPNTGRSYFQSERSSYEYRGHFFRRSFLAGRTIIEVANLYQRVTTRPVADNAIWIVRDYENFHGPAGTPAARRYLYIDGHVSDFQN